MLTLSLSTRCLYRPIQTPTAVILRHLDKRNPWNPFHFHFFSTTQHPQPQPKKKIINGATVLLFRPVVDKDQSEREVLLVQRSKDPLKGYWAFPGGQVEPNESIDIAARREFFEECNLQVNLKGFITITDVSSPSKPIIYRLHHFLAEEIPPEQEKLLRHGDDALALGWISISTIMKAYQRMNQSTSKSSTLPVQKIPESTSRECSSTPAIPILDSTVQLVPELDTVLKLAINIR